LLYVHSDTTRLGVGEHTAAKVFCILYADGDWSKATKMLQEKGYGTQKILNIKTKGGMQSDEIDAGLRNNNNIEAFLNHYYGLRFNKVMSLVEIDYQNNGN